MCTLFFIFNLILKGPTQHQLPKSHPSLDTLLTYTSPHWPPLHTPNPTPTPVLFYNKLPYFNSTLPCAFCTTSSQAPPAPRCSMRPREHIAAGKDPGARGDMYLALWRPGRGATDSAWRDWKAASGGSESSRKTSQSIRQAGGSGEVERVKGRRGFGEHCRVPGSCGNVRGSCRGEDRRDDSREAYKSLYRMLEN